ncbi:MAG: DUF58 domain-containing protein [Chloroflexota bacterium]
MKTASTSNKLLLQSRLWPALAALLLLLQILWPNKVWTAMLIILGGAWLLGFLWARSLARGLSLDRKMRYGWAMVGDRLEQIFAVSNRGWAPGLWLEVEDHSTLPGFIASTVITVGGRGLIQWEYEEACTRRGLYTLGPTSLRSGDPLGIYRVEIHQPDSNVLLVLPPVLPLPAIEVAPGGRAGEGRRPRRAALETTVSTDTVREYVPGDPLKSVHWPTTARRGSLYVRQFEHTPSSDWWIFLDLEECVQVGQDSDSTEEHGVILAASLADRGLSQGHSVGLVVCGKELTWIPPQRHSGQLMDILRALAQVHAGDVSLSNLLTSSKKSLQRGASLVLITPNVKAGWIEPLLQLSASEVASTVLLLDPVSFGGTEATTQADYLLNKYGIAHTIIQSDLLKAPEIRQNAHGQWRWFVMGRGKTIPARQPKEKGWRPIG